MGGIWLKDSLLLSTLRCAIILFLTSPENFYVSEEKSLSVVPGKTEKQPLDRLLLVSYGKTSRRALENNM